MNTAVATQERQPRSVLLSMSDRYGMEPAAFEATLRATVVPKEVSREQFAAFLLVAKQYSLNPILKEIYAFPTKSGGIQPIVGVDGWANLINSHAQCDGIEFEDHLDDKGKLTAITCQIFRKDRSHPTTATEYMEECKRNTDPWKQWPRRMLRHKALIQAARYAFGFSGIIDPDEWERSPENAEPPPAKQKAEVIQPQKKEGSGKALPPVVGEKTDEGPAPFTLATADGEVAHENMNVGNFASTIMDMVARSENPDEIHGLYHANEDEIDRALPLLDEGSRDALDDCFRARIDALTEAAEQEPQEKAGMGSAGEAVNDHPDGDGDPAPAAPKTPQGSAQASGGENLGPAAAESPAATDPLKLPEKPTKKAVAEFFVALQKRLDGLTDEMEAMNQYDYLGDALMALDRVDKEAAKRADAMIRDRAEALARE